MPVLSAARQRGSSSGLGAVTKGMPLRMVLSLLIPPPPRQPGRNNRAKSCQCSIRHMEHGLPSTPPRPTVPSANNSCLITDPPGILATCPRRGAARPAARAIDPTQVGIVGADVRPLVSGTAQRTAGTPKTPPNNQ
eukprot:356041-Chlamydomonas_euryale.AAC.4